MQMIAGFDHVSVEEISVQVHHRRKFNAIYRLVVAVHRIRKVAGVIGLLGANVLLRVVLDRKHDIDVVLACRKIHFHSHVQVLNETITMLIA